MRAEEPTPDAKPGASEEPGEQRPSAPESPQGSHGLGVRSPLSHKLHPTAQKILAAANKILRERGYAAMTLQAISAEARVNKAGVWYYFGGKPQLVNALLEEVLIRESHHFGVMPPAGATLDERVDLIVGSAGQVGERVQRFAAFYELLPEARRDADLHRHLVAIYEGWYAWAAEVLAPAKVETAAEPRQSLGHFASILLDGIFMQTIIAAPSFDLEAALENARRALTVLASEERRDRPQPS
jgi:AcrR family transcriptional regulator